MKDKLEAYKVEQIEKTIRKRNIIGLALIIPLALGVAFVAFAFLSTGFIAGSILFLIILLLLIFFIIILIKGRKDPLKYRDFFSVYSVDGVSNKRLLADIRDKEDYKYDREYGFVSDLFKRKVSVNAVNVSAEYVQRCIQCFQSLDKDEIDKLVSWAWDDVAMCRELYDFDQAGVRMDEDAFGADILDYIYPEVMYIPEEEMSERQEDPEGIIFTLTCDAEWELAEYEVNISVEDGQITQIESY